MKFAEVGDYLDGAGDETQELRGQELRSKKIVAKLFDLEEVTN